MLPSKPKIFHGRDFELEDIMKILAQESPRVSILGAGGMGKTSLARAVLHHPDTSAKFGQRFFVSAESAMTSVELAALIGLHVGLNPGTNLTQPVVKFFSKMSSSLLVLDNLETPWEPVQTRGDVEEFLSLLTDIPQLALIVSDFIPAEFRGLISDRLQCGEQKDQPKSTGAIHFCHL
jgi:ABC-type branched-subunit amino acid transport system ATPase component